MSYPKVSLYRHCVNQVRKQYKVTALDFDIVLFLSDKSVGTRDDILKYVSKSRGVVSKSLIYLKEQRFINVVQEHKVGLRGRSSSYSIAVRGRHMVTDFYMKLFPNYL